jgi:hypothetical protein
MPDEEQLRVYLANKERLAAAGHHLMLHVSCDGLMCAHHDCRGEFPAEMLVRGLPETLPACKGGQLPWWME